MDVVTTVVEIRKESREEELEMDPETAVILLDLVYSLCRGRARRSKAA